MYLLAEFEVNTFFSQFFLAGGPIVWLVLLPMSIVMLYLGIDLLIRLRRSRLLPAERSGEIMKLAVSHGAIHLPKRLEREEDLISRSAASAIGRSRKKGLGGDLIFQYASESLQEQGLRLLRKAEGCHLIGTVAPMIGLFGTVFGMIKAFTVLGAGGGQPSPEQLASAISEALVTTFWGLLIAIPALFFHGFFRVRIEGLITDASMETELLLERLVELDQHQRFNHNPTAPRELAEETEIAVLEEPELDEPVTLELEIEEE